MSGLERNQRLAARRRGLLGALLAGVALVAAMGIPVTPKASAAEGGLRLLGRLPEPNEALQPQATSHTPFLIDHVDKRLYYSYVKPFNSNDPSATYIREYDLTPAIPRFVRESRLASPDEISPASSLNPNQATIDRKRNRLLIVSFSGNIIACSDDPTCGGRGAVGRIFVVDRKTLRVTDVWVVGDRVPGFLPEGLVYSPEDDRIYSLGIIGSFIEPNDLLTGKQPRNPPVAVAALDPENGNLVWIRPVPECAVQMSSADFGAAVYRSRLRNALYFACIRTDTSPETAGLVRLWIQPRAGVGDAAAFPLEVFPISGSYASGKGVTGVSSFDPATDRLFLMSQSPSTPGTWVFDGRLSAWVGFVTAPADNNRYAAVDVLTGRFYMAGEPGEATTVPNGGPELGYLVVSDGRQTPVPQGEVIAFGKNAVDSYPIYVDPRQRRLFVSASRKNGGTEWLVYRDAVPVAQPPPEIDYDALTTQTDEGPETLTTFAATVNGFGSRVLLTGGTGGATAIAEGVTLGLRDALREGIDAIIIGLFGFQPARSDRGLFAARVTSLDLRNVGTSASARALALDPISDGEYETAVRATANRVRSKDERADEEREREEGRPDDDDDPGDDIERQLAWPYEPAFCLDAGEDAATDDVSNQGGTAQVSCDLKSRSVRASSSFDAFSIPGISIGHSSFVSEVVRDAKLGTVTRTTAVTRGIEMSGPGGSVTIARVVATATTRARGRSKTATAGWERRLEGVVVKDAAGRVLYECTQGDACDASAAVAAMNRVLVNRMRVSLREPLITATDGGAFAAVEESDGDFLNGLIANNDDLRAVPALTITVFNDWTEKSRLVVELAAIQASSIYGITPLPGFDAGRGAGLPSPIPPVVAPPLPPILDGALPPRTGKTAIGRLVENPLFLIRSPKQAFLFGLTLLLFAGPAAAIWRRRTLVRELHT